jgi:hypothetical protein
VEEDGEENEETTENGKKMRKLRECRREIKRKRKIKEQEIKMSE